VRSAGLEWLWRLGLEPSRWRRQLVLPQFWFLERREVRR
jgi:UDP-N-acetyl-D-mannosaminuronic acid transferase (WecB/TagA/CpsF family)